MDSRSSPGPRHGGIDTGEGRRLVPEMQLGVHGVWTRPGRPAAQSILGEVVEGKKCKGRLVPSPDALHSDGKARWASMAQNRERKARDREVPSIWPGRRKKGGAGECQDQMG
ncbi:hypothetical protein CKAH01_05929 [Colletotrichum kahawae]|uniref:Uncharacterized protein n=1 Tax=Colletotrichum kahawae TaxID=34407 RepID=A0AAE0D4W2_COLKA|nr:hypothetical protein CKAH01_05929 [Colletotrichum kahawae]